MRTVRFLLVFLVLAVAAMPGSGSIALAQEENPGSGHPFLEGEKFLAVLTGSQETPPVETNAKGASLVRLNRDETMLLYFVAVHNIQNVGAAHIHCAPPGVAGEVVVPLYPKDVYQEPTTSHLFVIAGTATEANITPVPDSEACPGGISTFAELVAKMRSGETYVNVHTEQYPAGEVRGQLIPLQ